MLFNANRQGFHEAVGDAISLSVATPEHLKKIKLLDSDVVIDDGTFARWCRVGCRFNLKYEMKGEEAAECPGTMRDYKRVHIFLELGEAIINFLL